MEILIAIPCILVYLAIGIGVTKIVFVLNKFLYNTDNINDQMSALTITIMWPMVAGVGGFIWISNKVFKRIL